MRIKLAILIVVASVLAYQILSGEIIPLVVLSGSMVPYMYPGDLILVKKIDPNEISVGDVICFKDPSGRENVLITHRVVNVTERDGKLVFKTKGDALEEVDFFEVKEEDIVGTPVLLIPMIGYLHENKKLVYFSMILLPSILILFVEVKNLKNPEVVERLEEKKKRVRQFLKRRQSISFKRAVLTIIVSYVLIYVLLHQDFVPVQRVTIGEGKVRIQENFDPYDVYFLIPPFYIENLYRINPVLPEVAIVLYPLMLSLLLSPLWKTYGGSGKIWGKRFYLRSLLRF
ncbi:peptidase S26B, signal peptidase [Ferroglobus placidus DSM 10642]|uniref:Peptidase S26B, signal peptidase n=1 Tax=Ferroglobus placidus (strain DSM 10642 / AEDII12DO) TaxID=589924 RepID=D3RZD2_FERPA|nr:signal peptidase I [Ferroglobus placidus]ADC65845.1 peptidase S26B, signal peptidase [Ferroglobus placidus DSM 10642]